MSDESRQNLIRKEHFSLKIMDTLNNLVKLY